jgi:hypothetical protein
LFLETRNPLLAKTFLLAAALIVSGSLASAQIVDAAITNLSGDPAAPVASPLSVSAHLGVDQIVQKLADSEKKRAQDLKGYTEQRQYSVTYKGFPANMSAAIVVEATYSAPGTKQFRILSQTGSKMLADHVLKKLLEAEQESAADPRQTAPTAANYNFTLVGQQMIDGRPCYQLQVEPKTKSRLLYRGTIWVDADDFAVAKIEAEPARNPSFWIRDTKIHHVNAKTGEFWLPEHNESDTDVRLGGRATLTIDYGAYKMDSPDPRTQQAALQSQTSALRK